MNAEEIATNAKSRIRAKQKEFEKRIDNWGGFSPFDSYSDFKSLTGDYKEKDGKTITIKDGEIPNQLIGILNQTRTEFDKYAQEKVEKNFREKASAANSQLGLNSLFAGAAGGIGFGGTVVIASSMTGSLFGSTFLGGLFGVALFSNLQAVLIATGIGIPVAIGLFWGAIEFFKSKTKDSLSEFADKCIDNVDDMKYQAEKIIKKRNEMIAEAIKNAKTKNWM